MRRTKALGNKLTRTKAPSHLEICIDDGKINPHFFPIGILHQGNIVQDNMRL